MSGNSLSYESPEYLESSIKRFWEKVAKPEDDLSLCWEWMGSLNDTGYGNCYFNKKTQKAHRVSWAIANGRWPDKWILHSCDNPKCVNPSHLWEGTPKQNTHDAMAKGRWGPKMFTNGLSASRKSKNVGSANPKSKLTETAVQEIRRRANLGELQTVLALEFKVTSAAINFIVRRKSWAQVP